MKISIVIPVYNDPLGIVQTMDSLLDQEGILDEIEIIIVDNNSRDENFNRLKNEVTARSVLPIKLIRELNIQSSYAARNLGIKESSGELLIFIDSNVTFASDLISKIIAEVTISKSDYFGVNVQMKSEISTVAGIYNYVRGFNVEESINLHRFTPTCFLICKRHVIEKIGPFDDRLISGGDFEFGKRVFDMGFKQEFLKDCLALHPQRTSFNALIKKTKRIAKGFAQLMHYYPDSFDSYRWGKLSFSQLVPRNPIVYLQICRKKQFSITFLGIIWLSMIHIPITILNVYYTNLYSRKLNGKL